MHVEAIAELASRVSREWGENYHFANVSPGPVWGSAVGEVWASDGSVFYVGAKRYGEGFTYSDHKNTVVSTLAGRP